MYEANNKKRRTGAKFMTVLVSVVLILAVAVGTTIAYLTTKTDDVVNTFEPTQVTSLVVENFTPDAPTTKANVQIKNTGDIDAYIRAAVVITWKDAQGNIAAVKPVETIDYTITWNTVDQDGTKWFEVGGYYYYPDVVAAGGTTAENLINSVQPVNLDGKEIDGTIYYLSVEIISSAIQAKPDRAVSEAWPAVTVDNGQLKAVSNG